MTAREIKAPRNKQFRVDITPEIIADATERDSSHCMIADAVRAQLPGAQRVAVDLQTIRWTDEKAGLRYVCFTPANGQRALVEFDQGKPVEPFSLRIRAVQVVEAGAKRRERTGEPARKGGGKTLVTSDRSDTKRQSPMITGGTPPPIAALSNSRGRRREFGLRTISR